MHHCKKLYFMRHGDTGKTGRFIGSSDVAITNEAAAALSDMQIELAKFGFARIFCSPMYRCRQTAENLQIANLIEIDARLREIDFGAWEGLSYQEAAEQFPDELKHWQAEPGTFSFPDGESLAAFHSRVREVHVLLKECREDLVLVISHAGVIRYLICELLNMDTEQAIKFNIHPAKMVSIDLFSEGGILTGLNISL